MRVAAASVTQLLETFAWRWPHVDPRKEWACKGTGQIVVETDFLDRVEQLRARYGRALIISSGYRSPGYNQSVSTTGADGPHTTARAVDLLVAGADALRMLQLALELGFTGIGLKQHGRMPGRFLHLDDLPQLPERPRPWIWTY